MQFSETIKKRMKFRNSFYSVLIGFIFSVVYFFITAKFFEIWKITPIVIFPHFGILIISIVILFYGFSIKEKAKEFLFLGSGCLILSQLIHIPMIQYWITVNQFNPFYWMPTIIFNALGFIFLLVYIREGIK